MKRTQTRAQLGGWFYWQVFVMATLGSENIFLFQVSVSNQNFNDGFHLEFDFFPGHCNRHLQQSALFTLLCMTGLSFSNLRYEHHLHWQQNRSKATMWKMCEFQLFGGAEDVFSRLTILCRMLLPHNPYRLPQHCKRHVCGPPYSCKHKFLWISPILIISFVWIVWVQYATDNLSGQQLEFVT